MESKGSDPITNSPSNTYLQSLKDLSRLYARQLDWSPRNQRGKKAQNREGKQARKRKTSSASNGQPS